MMNYLIQRMRDRRMLLIIGVLSILLLSELLVYLPWELSLKKQMQQVSDEQSMINFLQNSQSSNEKPSSLTSSNLLAYISEQLHKLDLKSFNYQLQQISSKEVRLSFVTVPYITLMQWLWLLTNNQSVTFSKLELTQTSTPGLVQANIYISYC